MSRDLAPPVLVLVEPQDIVNVAGSVRVAKNFGLERIRLVAPREYDPWRVEGIAHNTGDLLDRLEVHPTLEHALADCVYAVALTARERRAKRTMLRPRAAAAELATRAPQGPVAVVAGREDKGLTNEELDQCHALVTIPTNPDYRSLNLAQAVGVLLYEAWLARREAPPPFKPPRKDAETATGEQLTRLFDDWERALWAIDFFKTRQPSQVMRSVRELVYRAGPDGRESTLLRAIMLEVVRYLERQGVPPAATPPERTPDT